MKYYSTRNKAIEADFSGAALGGLAPDGGLYIPETIPAYPQAVVSSLGAMDLRDVAIETIKPYTDGVIPSSALEDIVVSAFDFPAPLVPVGGRFVLELFHGPTAAFKDFGARFMARAFSYLRRGEDRPLRILVATSGDTGGAAAAGFYQVPGIFVTVLYPKGRVSPLQERQIAGLGANISALAVDGSFDDCQRLVKAALADPGLKKRLDLSSANSINVSRLIPQAVYYAAAAGKAAAGKHDDDCEATPRRGGRGGGVTPGRALFVVPSGNFGNLTAGLYAYKMGAPIRGFAAATNINKTVPDYLASGEYLARSPQATLSNAMDVGAPSNFERMAAHFTHADMRRMMCGVSVTDEQTRAAIRRVYGECGYYLDPHTAVGWHAADCVTGTGTVCVLSTAHPAKFAETVEPLCGPVPVPPSLSQTMKRTVDSRGIPADEQFFIELVGALK